MRRLMALVTSLLVATSLGTVAVASDHVEVLDTFDVTVDGPRITGSLSTDGANLFLEVRGDPFAEAGLPTYMAWVVYVGDETPVIDGGPWDGAFLLADVWQFKQVNQDSFRWGVGSGSTHPWGTLGAVPTAVEITYTTDGKLGIWQMRIPYWVLAIEPGDTIRYLVQARYDDAGDEFEGFTTGYVVSHGPNIDRALEHGENFQTVVLPSPAQDPGPEDPEAEDPETEDQVEQAGGDPQSREDCQNGGWEDYGFANQGECIRYVNTEQDTRPPEAPLGDDPQSRDDCRNGGWALYGFANEGLCVQFVNTGRDTRP